MADIRLVTHEEVPEEGTGKIIALRHPITDYDFKLALFQVKGKYYAIANDCGRCMGNLGTGKLNGLYVSCPQDDTPWSIKNGLCKFDRTQSVSSHKIRVEDDGLYTNI